eukprot:2583521-Heterocapsa_arctica.AAC.1
MYDHLLAPRDSEAYLDPADSQPIPGLLRLCPRRRDPYGLWIERLPMMIPWRDCPKQNDPCRCGLAIPAALTVCPYCMTPLVFTPALPSGAPR